MMDPQPLARLVDSKLIREYRSTKTEIKDYYGSSRAAAEALYGRILNKKTGEPVKVESIMRRFQNRGGKSQGEMGAVYKELGRELPPLSVKPPETITVTVRGQQGQRDREWTATFKGAAAYRFSRNPSYKEFFKQLGYKPSVVEAFNGDDSSGVVITAVV